MNELQSHAHAKQVEPPALWTFEDIARYLRRSVRTVRENYSIRPDFPRAIRIGGVGDPLYFPEEIVQWLKTQRTG